VDVAMMKMINKTVPTKTAATKSTTVGNAEGKIGSTPKKIYQILVLFLGKY